MPPAKPEKKSPIDRPKPSPTPEPAPRERLNLGCGTLLIAICMLGLLGKFLPHRSLKSPTPVMIARQDTPNHRETPSIRPSPPPAPPTRRSVMTDKPKPSPDKPKPAPEPPREVSATPSAPEAARPAVFNNPWDRSVAQVEQHIKRGLHDASSFEAVEWGKVEPTKDGFKVRCTYRARNLLGNLATQTRTFILDRKGQVLRAKDERGRG